MPKRIVVIQGHPDPSEERFCRALAEAYAGAAEAAGHEVRVIDVARIEFPVLRSQQEFEEGVPVEPIRQAQESIAWANHLLVVYPLWMGAMPALLKAFFEQVLRPGFGANMEAADTGWTKRLKGHSARIVVTMGMPAFFYRWYFRAHSLKNLKRNILGFCGVSPVRATLIGAVEALDDAGRQKWLKHLQELGRAGA